MEGKPLPPAHAHAQVCNCDDEDGSLGIRYPHEPGPETCYVCMLAWNVDDRDARIAELEAERDAAVKRAEEAEAKLNRLFSDLVKADDRALAAEQREVAALRDLAEAEADLETVADQHLAALASLEALAEEASRFMACALKDVAVAAHKADTLGSVDLERKTALLIEHGRCLGAAIDATTTTEGASKVLARCPMHGSAWVAKSGGGCVECMATAEEREGVLADGGDDD